MMPFSSLPDEPTLEKVASNEQDRHEIRRLIRVDIPDWQDKGDNFTCQLFSLIAKSDPYNLYKLGKVYPNQVKAWWLWYNQQHRERDNNGQQQPE